MHIRTYDDVDPKAVHRLNMTAFGWRFPHERVSRIRRADPRCFDGFALYAVEDGIPIAQVIPFRMRVRLRSGVETVGAIAGVCSHPAKWGQGYARKTMERAHEWFREEGLRIATLTTSRNIRGYGIYEKMGYVDLAPFYRAYRTVPRTRPRHCRVRFRHAKRADLPVMRKLFETYTRGLLGWTVREPAHLPSLLAWDPKYLEKFRIVLRGRKPVGYIRTKPDEGVHMEEVIVPRPDDFRETVALAERKARHGIACVNWITSRKDQDRFRTLGYQVDGPIADATMALSLDRDLAPGELIETFGVSAGIFAQYPTEDF